MRKEVSRGGEGRKKKIEAEGRRKNHNTHLRRKPALSALFLTLRRYVFETALSRDFSSLRGLAWPFRKTGRASASLREGDGERGRRRREIGGDRSRRRRRNSIFPLAVRVFLVRL